MPFELLIFLLTERALCFVLHVTFTGENMPMQCLPSEWMWDGEAQLLGSVGFLHHRVPLWPQAGSLDLFLLRFLYSKGHIDLPHRGVVRINKGWYSALEG